MVHLIYINPEQYGFGNSNYSFKRYESMKTIYITSSLVITAITVLSFACVGSKCNSKTKQEYTSLDSLWLPFAKAMELKDIEFLTENSLDSLACYDCNIYMDNQQEYFDSEFLLKNHLDKVMHLTTLTDKPFSTYQVQNDLLRIGYIVKTPQAPEGAYSLFFTLVKKGKKYYFQGMMVQ